MEYPCIHVDLNAAEWQCVLPIIKKCGLMAKDRPKDQRLRFEALGGILKEVMGDDFLPSLSLLERVSGWISTKKSGRVYTPRLKCNHDLVNYYAQSYREAKHPMDQLVEDLSHNEDAESFLLALESQGETGILALQKLARDATLLNRKYGSTVDQDDTQDNIIVIEQIVEEEEEGEGSEFVYVNKKHKG